MASKLEKGILQDTLAPWLTFNYGPGKTENMRQLLEREPVFAPGDSEGDYEMLTVFPGTRLKLLIRRCPSGKMAALYKKALKGDPQYLLQDVDRSTGQFSAVTVSPPVQFKSKK